ncbi:MAG: hypothetical protein IKZ44_04280, partial [Clostridia bacterium]|nr:hypothetical protein [Clostridia bacterium]
LDKTTLEPGESATATFTHVVTEQDILAGKVANEATATGDNPSDDPTDDDPGDTDDPVEEKNAKMTVTKETTSTPEDGAYVLDEVITYKITVTNDGNVTLTNVKVTDELTGDEWTIDELAPGASKEFTATHKVTVDDVVAGSVTNEVTATAVDPENEEVNGNASVTDETKKKDGNDVDPEPDPDDPGEELDVDSKSITVVYDGKAHTLTAKATVEGSTVWYSIDGGEWTTTAPSRTAVGTTTFSIKATHPAYNDVVKDGYSLTVLPKDLTITIDDAWKYQGDADPEFTYSVDGLVEGETIPAGIITLFRDEGEEIGTYTIHGKLGAKAFMKRASLRRFAARIMNNAKGETTFDPANYNITFVEGTFEIRPRPYEGFTMMWVSDTLLKGEGAYDDAFKTIVDYANKAGKLDAVISTGNVVDAFDNEAAWTSAKNALSGLRKQFFGIAGVKDVNGDEMNYEAYLAAGMYNNVTAFEDGSVWYRRFSDQQVLVVGIGYQKIAETDEEKEREEKWLSFVNDAIAKNSSYQVILVVNDYMDAAGELTAFGKLVEEKIVEGNENVFMVLCGNADGAFHKEMTYGERNVAVVMFNYAADEQNGLGIVRIVTIDAANKKVKFETIDAATGKAFTYDAAAPEADAFTFEDLF